MYDVRFVWRGMGLGIEGSDDGASPGSSDQPEHATSADAPAPSQLERGFKHLSKRWMANMPRNLKIRYTQLLNPDGQSEEVVITVATIFSGLEGIRYIATTLCKDLSDVLGYKIKLIFRLGPYSCPTVIFSVCVHGVCLEHA